MLQIAGARSCLFAIGIELNYSRSPVSTGKPLEIKMLLNYLKAQKAK